MLSLEGAGRAPPGNPAPEGAYDDCVQRLQPGDQIIFYTDGITEAGNPEGKLFGTDRLDHVLENCSLQASALLDSVLEFCWASSCRRPSCRRRSDVDRRKDILTEKSSAWETGIDVGRRIGSTGLAYSVYLGKTRLKLSPSDTLTFHAVGDREPSAFKLVEFDQIVLG